MYWYLTAGTWRFTHLTYRIPVKYHGFAVSLTILAMKSRSHANYVISHAFQLKQNLRKLILWFGE